MEWIKIAGAILFSITSSGVIILGFSSWLGKVWASRILEKERNELAILKETYLKEHGEKILAYKTVIDVVSKILADFDKWQRGDSTIEEGKKAFHEFNEERLRVYGYLGMVAPQSVMNAQDALMDQIISIANGNDPYDWAKIRELALSLINEIRKDVAINKDPICYNGKL